MGRSAHALRQHPSSFPGFLIMFKSAFIKKLLPDSDMLYNTFKVIFKVVLLLLLTFDFLIKNNQFKFKINF